MKRPRTPRKVRPVYRRTYITQWREYRGLTQKQLAERLDVTESHVSMIENGKRPYTQATLEAIAEALSTDPASLLMRDPSDPDAIWSIWDQAKPGEKRAIVEHAKIILRTGT